MTVVRATFPTSNPNTTPASTWDLGGGAPDPYVCAYLNDSTTPLSCSGPPGVADTFSPTWNKSWDVTVSATTSVDVSAYDEDTTSPDFMGGWIWDSGAKFVSAARRGGFTSPAYTGDPITWTVTITAR